MAVNIVNRADAEAIIREQIVSTIFQDAPKQSVFMSMARKLPNMTSKQTRIRVLDFLPTAYWVDGDTCPHRPWSAGSPWDSAYSFRHNLPAGYHCASGHLYLAYCPMELLYPGAAAGMPPLPHPSRGKERPALVAPGVCVRHPLTGAARSRFDTRPFSFHLSMYTVKRPAFTLLPQCVPAAHGRPPRSASTGGSLSPTDRAGPPWAYENHCLR